MPDYCITELKADKALVQRAGDVPWTRGHEAQLRAIFDTPSKVGQFVYTLDEENLAPFLAIGEFRFVSLLGDDRLQLVANNDANGRAFFTELIIVRRTASGFTTEWIGGWDFEALGDHLVRLSKDGRTQILVEELMEPYAGYRMVPSLWHVYDWNGTKFVQSDSKYKAWYAKVKLPELRRVLHEEQAKPPDERDPDSLSGYKKEIAAVEKLLEAP
jgi:hypothetical protein